MTDETVAAREIGCFDAKVYTLDVVKRAAYGFAGKGGCAITLDGDQIRVHFTPGAPMTPDEITRLVCALQNAVLDQDLRDRIRRETADMRNLILANAFSRSGLIDP